MHKIHLLVYDKNLMDEKFAKAHTLYCCRAALNTNRLTILIYLTLIRSEHNSLK